MSIEGTSIDLYNEYLNIVSYTNKIDLFTEASARNLSISIKEAAVKCIENNLDEDTYVSYVQEAEENFITRVKQAIDKLIEKIKEFFEKCKNKIVETFTSKNINDALDKADNAIKNNPKIKNEKLEYKDTEDGEKELDKGIHGLRKILSKIKVHQTTDDTSKEIDDVREESVRKSAAVIRNVIITFGAAVILLRNMTSDIKTSDDDGADELKDAKSAAEKAESAEEASLYEKIASSMSRLKRESFSLKIFGHTSLAQAIRAFVFRHIKGETGVEIGEEFEENEIEESVIDKIPLFKANKLYLESVAKESFNENHTTVLGNVEGLDLDSYYESIVDDILTDTKDIF